jgi:protein transport protein SEC61 subunit gamma-like protein
LRAKRIAVPPPAQLAACRGGERVALLGAAEAARPSRIVAHHSLPFNLASRLALPLDSGLAKYVVTPAIAFGKDAQAFLSKCQRPKDQEYWAVTTATLVGFLVVGLTGYFIKLLHIPITQILVGAA